MEFGEAHQPHNAHAASGAVRATCPGALLSGRYDIDEEEDDIEQDDRDVDTCERVFAEMRK